MVIRDARLAVTRPVFSGPVSCLGDVNNAHLLSAVRLRPILPPVIGDTMDRFHLDFLEVC